jgi:cytochrome P450
MSAFGSDEQANFLATVDSEPWTVYERLRSNGVAWDDSLQAWVASTYSVCKHILRSDKKLFHHPAEDAVPSDVNFQVDGRANTMFLHGAEHTRVHAWWVQQFRPDAVARWRSELIAPLVARFIDQFADRGSAELSSELADPLPIRVISAVVGLPWHDDDVMDRLKELFTIKTLSFQGVRATHGGPTPTSSEENAAQNEAMLAHVNEVRAIVLPHIMARSSDPRDDFISRLWFEGPDLMEPWGTEEMFSAVYNILFSGTDTTSIGVRNAMYWLATEPRYRQDVIEGGINAAQRFAEESLRLTGSVQYRPRIASVDTSIGGVDVTAGERVIAVLASANRDPDHYDDADQIRLDRAAPQDHLSFNIGARFCVGAPLARAEIQEAVLATATRLPGLRLDPAGGQPEFHGFLNRWYAPLNVRFDVG